MAGAFAVAVWCIYWDLGRRARRARNAASHAAPETAGPSRGSRLLYAALAMIASSWLADYLSDRWGPWLEGLAGFSLATGAVFLGMHLARELAAPSREAEDRRDAG